MSNNKPPKADTIIRNGVIAAAAIGIQPALIDIPFLIGANAAMLLSLAKAYNYEWTEENVTIFIKNIIKMGGFSITTWKAIAAIVYGGLMVSIIGIPLALGVNGAVNALITYSFGQAGKVYLGSNGQAPDSEVIEAFADNLTFGGFRKVRSMIAEQQRQKKQRA